MLEPRQVLGLEPGAQELVRLLGALVLGPGQSFTVRPFRIFERRRLVALGALGNLGLALRRVAPRLSIIRFGAPLPRSSHARWMGQLPAHRYDRKMTRYVARVAAAGSWAAYERQHRADLARTFVPKFPRLPPDVIPTIVAFGFHTGHY